MKESQQVEWKQIWKDDYLKWLCGFANADGGLLVVGRDFRGVAVGVKNADKLLVNIPNKVRDILGIMVNVNLRQENGKELVEIRVDPYPSPVNYKGEYYYRSGSTTQDAQGRGPRPLPAAQARTDLGRLAPARPEAGGPRRQGARDLPQAGAEERAPSRGAAEVVPCTSWGSAMHFMWPPALLWCRRPACAGSRDGCTTIPAVVVPCTGTRPWSKSSARETPASAGGSSARSSVPRRGVRVVDALGALG